MKIESQEIETNSPDASTSQVTTNVPAAGAPIQIPAELNQQQALQVLVDAARVAQSKGIFSLDDAELVNKAIKAFIQPGPVPSSR